MLLVDQAIAREIVDEKIPGLTMPTLTTTSASSLTWKNCQDLEKIMYYSHGIGFADPCHDHWGDGLLAYDVLRIDAEAIFNIRDLEDITFTEKDSSFSVLRRMRGTPVLRGASGDLHNALEYASGPGASGNPEDNSAVVLGLRPGKPPPIEYICRYSRPDAPRTRTRPTPEHPQERRLPSAFRDIPFAEGHSGPCRF